MGRASSAGDGLKSREYAVEDSRVREDLAMGSTRTARAEDIKRLRLCNVKLYK